jgi:hypothetical protein
LGASWLPLQEKLPDAQDYAANPPICDNRFEQIVRQPAESAPQSIVFRRFLTILRRNEQGVPGPFGRASFLGAMRAFLIPGF